MFELAAPYPALRTQTILPNPEFGDGESLLDTLSVRRAMDGTLYTYVKKKNSRKKLSWTFSLTRNKALELLEFYRAYAAKKMKITDHRGRVWVGNLTSNPLEATADRRAGPALQDWPRGELTNATLEFEGTLQ